MVTLKDHPRFWSKISKTNSCWTWIGKISTTGYGVMMIGSRADNSRRYIKAHRISFFIHFGEIPDGMWILHKCDNPKCVNPEHLFAGTPKDNTQDMIKKGRARLKQYR